MVAIRFWYGDVNPYGILNPLNALMNQDIEGGVEVLHKEGWRPSDKRLYDIVDWLDSNEYVLQKIELVAHKSRPWKGQYVAHYSKGS
jgi:hypothetical protein